MNYTILTWVIDNLKTREVLLVPKCSGNNYEFNVVGLHLNEIFYFPQVSV